MFRYKICLIGETQSGKTTYLYRLLTGDLRRNYVPTLSAEHHLLSLKTNQGKITFDISDCGGNYPELNAGYYLTADAGIIMVRNIENIPDWIKVFRENNPDAPLVIAINSKLDEVQIGNIYTKYSSQGIPCYEVSPITNYNLEKPFLEIVRRLQRNPNLPEI